MLQINGNETIQNHLKEMLIEAYQMAKNSERHPDWIRKCQVISDIDFLLFSILRATIQVRSGLHFLQHLDQVLEYRVASSTWFDANESERRARMVMAVTPFFNKLLQKEISGRGVNHLQDFSELEDFDCVAYDGHFMKRASHMKNAPEAKNKANAGFIFGTDLRTGFLEPVKVVSDGSKKQSEIPFFKEFCKEQSTTSWYRKKKITVYDRAMASAAFLVDEMKKEHYLVTRYKKNSTWSKVEKLHWDESDPSNTNVLKDLLVTKKIKRRNETLRLIVYYDVERQKTYRFLTTLSTEIPPGLVAELYRRRWQVEKAFDNTKNDLGETKAWGNSISSMKIQMCSVACAYNLIRSFNELNLAGNPDMVHPAQIKQEKRTDQLRNSLAKSGHKINPLRLAGNLRRLSRNTVSSIQNAISLKVPIREVFRWLCRELKPRVLT
jgi:hypothetical protein